MQLPAALDEFLPDLISLFPCEVDRLEFRILKHIHEKLRNIDMEGGTGCGTHDGEGLTALGRQDILLLLFIDPAGLLIQLAEVIHIIGCQTEYKAVLAGIDDGRRLPGNLLAAHEILDILGDDDLHTVVLTDTLRQLEHKVQRYRELCIDKNMGLIDNDYDLPLQVIPEIVIPVLDNLIIDILQNQQHLRVGYGGVPVRQKGLEVEYREVLIRGYGGRSVPDIRISSAGGELGDVIHQGTQHLPQVIVVGTLKFCQDHIIKVIKDRIVFRMQNREIRLRRDAEV